MTRIFLYRTIVCVTALLFSIALPAQTRTVVKASVDRSQLLIGERLQLTLEADIPENQPIRFFQFDSLPHFEILGRGKIDTANTGSGTVLSQIIQITSFDSGHWVIPAFPLGEEFLTDSIPVDVGFSPFDPNQPYHDVKDILDAKPVKETEKSYLWWYIAGAVLLAGLIWAALRKRKTPQLKPPPPPVDPYKHALEQLAKLSREKLTAKAYYSGITDVFREYLKKRKNIVTEPASVREWKELFGEIQLGAITNDLLQVLTLSDSVKFAKYEPARTDDAHAVEVIRKAIEQIEQSIKPPVSAGQ